jgi:hypothetical protein
MRKMTVFRILCKMVMLAVFCNRYGTAQSVQEKLSAPAASYTINAAGSLSAL